MAGDLSPWKVLCRDFLEPGDASWRPRDLSAACGKALVEHLCSLRVLVPSVSPVLRIPSPMPEEAPGMWFVERNPCGEEYGSAPFWAYPVDHEENGLFALLSQEDVRGVSLDLRALARLITAALGIQGVFDFGHPVNDGVFHLGEASLSGRFREVLFAPSAHAADVEWLLRMREALGQPTLLIVPSSEKGVGTRTMRFTGQGVAVIAFLDGLLHFDGKALVPQGSLPVSSPTFPVSGVLTPSDLPMPVLTEKAPQKAAPEHILFTSLTQDGLRELTREEYDALEEGLDSFDMVLDLTRTGRAGRYQVQKRENGEVVKTSVSAAQGEAYGELMELGRSIRPSRLKRLHGTLHPRHELDLARAALDVRVSRYQWRATRLFKGEVPEAVEYKFDPPKGMKWLLLREKKS